MKKRKKITIASVRKAWIQEVAAKDSRIENLHAENVRLSGLCEEKDIKIQEVQALERQVRADLTAVLLETQPTMYNVDDSTRYRTDPYTFPQIFAEVGKLLQFKRIVEEANRPEALVEVPE